MSIFPNFDGTQHCAQPGIEPEWFHPHKNGSGARAKKVCGGSNGYPACPFLAACREYGVTHSVHGIWGGTNGDERQAERKVRNIIPEPLAFRVAAGAEITTTVFRKHGSWAGVGQHEKFKEPVCEECRTFRSANRSRKSRERKAAS